MTPDRQMEVRRRACAHCKGAGSFPPVDLDDPDYVCGYCNGDGLYRAPADTPNIFYRDGYWRVDTGNVCGWSHPSRYSLAHHFANRLNAECTDVPF